MNSPFNSLIPPPLFMSSFVIVSFLFLIRLPSSMHLFEKKLKKLYCHVNEQTLIVKWSEKPALLTAAILSNKLLQTYQKKKLRPTLLSHTTFTFDIDNVSELKHKDDVIATPVLIAVPPPLAPSAPSTPRAPAAPPTTQTTKHAAKKKSKKHSFTAAMRPLLKGAKEAYNKKMYRKAKMIYQQIYDLDTTNPNPAALYGLATVAAANHNHKDVLEACFPTIIGKDRFFFDDKNKTEKFFSKITDYGYAKDDPPFLELLGDSLFALTHLRGAIRCYDEAVQVTLTQQQSIR